MKTASEGTALPASLDEHLAHTRIRLVDVGASGGLQPPWQQIAACVDVVAFEPDPESFSVLPEAGPHTNIALINTALGERPGRATLHVTRRRGGSSLLPPDVDYLRLFDKGDALEEVQTLECQVDTLDAQLAAAGVDAVDFIKLDTQGTERLILEGASNTLRGPVVGVEVEVEFNALYTNQPLFPAVDALLRESGFVLSDLKVNWWPRWSSRGLGALGRGQVMWGEAIYLRSAGHLGSGAWPGRGPLPADDLARGVAICLLYGRGGHAHAVLEAASQRVDPVTIAALDAVIRGYDRAVADRGVQFGLALTPGQASAARKLFKRDGVDLASQIRAALGVACVEEIVTRRKPLALPEPFSHALLDGDFVHIDDSGARARFADAIEHLRECALGVSVPLALSENDDLPRPSDVDTTLRSAGFEMFDFALRRRPLTAGSDLVALGLGWPASARVLYVRGLRDLRARWRRLEAGSIEPDVARMVAVCLVAGCGDHALDVVDAASERLAYEVAAGYRRAIRRYDDDATRRGYRTSRLHARVIGDGEPSCILSPSNTELRRLAHVPEQTGRSIDQQVCDALDRWYVDRGVAKPR